jgi:phospholipase C
MMENRSFDHMLGYLKRDLGWEIDGLRPGSRDTNPYEGTRIGVHHLETPVILTDPDYERADVAEQLGAGEPGNYPMDGFVANFAHHHNIDADTPVMGYYTARELPLYHMFAEQFCICDKWFSSLPTSTHPNRLMALSGATLVSNTHFSLTGVPHGELVYEWLTKRHVNWALYYNRAPVFPALLQGWPDFVPEGQYRPLYELERSLRGEGNPISQVVFVEPTYAAWPFRVPFLGAPCDDHPPAILTAGQRFVRTVYQAATANPTQWKKTMMVVVYDEHGGFYDHVSPRPIRYDPPQNAFAPFLSTGVRVPAFVVSPFVSPKRLYSEPLDHTSILHFLGQKFGGGEYSEAVSSRQRDFGSLQEVLDLTIPRQDVPAVPEIPDLPILDHTLLGQVQIKREIPADMQVMSKLSGIQRRQDRTTKKKTAKPTRTKPSGTRGTPKKKPRPTKKHK